MERLNDFINKPSEVIIEIIFEGIFNPDVLGPLWMSNKSMLGKNEANQVNEKFHKQGEERSFSTQFFDINIKINKITIGTIDVLSYDLLGDFVTSFVHQLSTNIESFKINLLTHYTANNQNDRLKILNLGINLDAWTQLIENPKSSQIMLHEKFQLQNSMKNKFTTLSSCLRKDLKFPYHLFIHNNFIFNSTEIEIPKILTRELIVSTLNDSINSINKMLTIFK